jgi:cysteinyl-tRNA synthetase
LRDLVAKGHKPSSIRFLLLSVPYRRQLNFTMDGLQQAESSVARLRNFMDRIKTEQFSAGERQDTGKRSAQAEADFAAGLADDLNTAVALAAVFDLVRDMNTAMDRGEFRQQDALRVMAAMEKFDVVLGVLVDDDGEKMRRLGHQAEGAAIADQEIEKLIEERKAAKKRRDFKRADEIRQELAQSGIILEDSKDGRVRWKRK